MLLIGHSFLLITMMSTENKILLGSFEPGQHNYACDNTEFEAIQQWFQMAHIYFMVWAILGVLFIVGVILALIDPGHLNDSG